MEVVRVVKGRTRVLLVRMSTKEALRTIESLSQQIQDGSPNARRWECFAEENGGDRKRIDFSIAVHPKR